MKWMSHHLDCVHKSGLSVASGTCRAHRRLSEAFQLLLQEDPLNVRPRLGSPSGAVPRSDRDRGGYQSTSTRLRGLGCPGGQHGERGGGPRAAGVQPLRRAAAARRGLQPQAPSLGGGRGKGSSRAPGQRGRGRGTYGAAHGGGASPAAMTSARPGPGRRRDDALASRTFLGASARCSRPGPSESGLPRPPLDRGRAHTTGGRCHGDPFPLPIFGGGVGDRPRRLSTRSLAFRCAECCRSLKRLDAPSAPCRNSRIRSRRTSR